MKPYDNAEDLTHGEKEKRYFCFNVKVTIALSKHSVDFFRKEAKQKHTQYQKMIRRLLDYYVAQHEELPLTKQSS